jgi:S-adenosylmethionine synthetase
VDGTGKYVRHGSLGDSGLTGRKIIASGGGSGGYAPHGGGSAVKPHYASDKLLPLFARFIAKTVIDAGLANTCTVALSGAIGQKKLQSLRISGDGLKAAHASAVAKFIRAQYPEISPKTINELFRTFELNNFDAVIFDCLTGGDPKAMPWEDTVESARKLKEFIG